MIVHEVLMLACSQQVQIVSSLWRQYTHVGLSLGQELWRDGQDGALLLHVAISILLEEKLQNGCAHII